jgi:hypothetical protein
MCKFAHDKKNLKYFTLTQILKIDKLIFNNITKLEILAINVS